jgi:hypothetical protein
MNMPSLRELQSSFAAAVFSGGEAPGEFLSCCTGSQVERGLQAYRNSVLANLAGAVRMSYPVLQRIVGQAFLDAAIRHYVLERPSTSGDLNAYGGDFDAFIDAYEPAAELPYLPDVARLEWQVQCLYGMADAPAQDLALLASTQPEHWGDLHFRLDPAHTVLASHWPLARIWDVNQPGYDGNFQVDFDVPQTVLVHRRLDGTVVERLDDGECVLIDALAAGASLAEAVEQAARHETFELQAALQRFVTNGLIRQAC